MKAKLTICDICIADGKIKLAKCEYQGGAKTYHACDACMKNFKKYGIKIIEKYDYIGNPSDDMYLIGG